MSSGPPLDGGNPAGVPSRVVAGFELGGELGRGGHTVTYRVRRGSATYAMKILMRSAGERHRQRGAGEEPPDRAFRREAALLASVDDPGVVRVHEVGVERGLPYLVMDYVDGRRLADLLVDGPLPVGQLLAIGMEVAPALGAAHRAGLVHRDVKPDNILIDTAGHARVIDFGLAVRPGEIEDDALAGTLLYCAPEQSGMLHRPVDGRADLYALGAVLFECATGRPPFLSGDVGGLLRLHATIPASDPRTDRPELPLALSGIIGRLLAKDPDDRYQSADGLLADLRRLAAGETDFPLGVADRPGPRADRPLVGREAELSGLVRRWQRAREGVGGSALIHGQPGSGKSRLAWELAGRARLDGALVLVGENEPDDVVPLAPLRVAVDSYVDDVDRLPEPQRTAAIARVRRAAAGTASLLRGFSPSLDAMLLAPDLVDADRHVQFSGALAGFLAALASESQGMLLLLDDVQWLDAATRRVLQQLVPRLSGTPLLVVGAGRNDAASASAMAATRMALGGSVDLVLDLEPMRVEAVASLVASVTGGLRVDEPTAESLTIHSGGNPFTLLQYLDAVIDAGLLRPHWGRWILDTGNLQDLDLPIDGVELILNRLEGLDDDSRHLLGVAAVFGSTFSTNLVEEVCGTGRAGEVAHAAAWRNLVEPHGDGRFSFVHDRIREALLAQFDHANRRDVHERIAAVIARGEPHSPDAVYALARHRLLGEADRDPAAVYRACYAAGRLAAAEHAPDEALWFLERAASAAASAGITADTAFLTTLATAQQRGGRFAAALDTARLAHERAGTPIERARSLGLAAEALDTAWSCIEESETVEQALTELGYPTPTHRVKLAVTTAWNVVIGQLSRLTRIGYGTATGDQAEVYRLRTALYVRAAWAYARQLRPARSLLFNLRSVYPVSRIGPGPEEARQRIGMSYVDISARLPRLARRSTERAIAIAADVGDPLLIGYVAWLEGYYSYTFGRDQGQRLRRVLSEHGRFLEIGLHSDLILMLLWDAMLRGDMGESESLAGQRQALLKLTGAVGGAVMERFTSGTAVRGATAWLLAQQDRGAEASQLLADLPAGTMATPWELLPVRGAAIWVAYERHELGETFDRAVADFEALRLPATLPIPFARGFHIGWMYGRLEQCRHAEDADRPTRLAQAQMAMLLARRAANTPLLRAHYRVGRASLLQVMGRPKEALAHLAKHELSLFEVDAPAVAFELARVRAYALGALRQTGEAGRQARHALYIARENNWPHWARRTIAEFGIHEETATMTRSAATSGEGITLSLYRERLAAIEQVGQAASRVLDPVRLATIALDETIRILGAERAFLFLLEGEPPHLVPHGGRDADGKDVEELTGYSTSTVEQVRQTQEPVVITGTEEAAALGAQSVVLHGLRSIVVAPLQLDGRLLGVVYLDSRVAKGIFTAEDVGVLVAITNHIAVALETARAAQLEVEVGAANRQRDLAETVRDALAEITGTLEAEPEQVLRRLMGSVRGTVGGERAWLLLGHSGDPRVRVFEGDDEARSVRVDAGLARLLAAGHTEIGEDDAFRPELLDGGEQCWLAVPLVARDEPLGVLLLAAIDPHAYDDGRADLATALVGQGMVAYENTRLFAQVQQLATIDDLTGIANRRHFFDLAERELARARRNGRGLAAMMIDIDNFKRVNDDYGHQLGDMVIQAVVGRLGRYARAYDVLARYGGEEFALLVAPVDHDPGAVAERLRAAVADAPVRADSGDIWVTVSIGVATLDSDEEDVNSLLARADRRLYEAKRTGRNRVATEG